MTLKNESDRQQILSIFEQSPNELPIFIEICSMLGMSHTKLRRRLKKAGTSYNGLKREFRSYRAKSFLSRGELVPKAVAYELGYSYPSDFHRDFRRWTGQTVRQFIATL